MDKISGSGDVDVSHVDMNSFANAFHDIKIAPQHWENIISAIKCLFDAVHNDVKCIFSLKKCCFLLLNQHYVKLSNPHFLNPKVLLEQAKIDKIITYLNLGELHKMQQIIETFAYPTLRVSAEKFKQGARIIDKITKIRKYQRNTAKRASFSDDEIKQILGVLDATAIYSLLERMPFVFSRKWVRNRHE